MQISLPWTRRESGYIAHSSSEISGRRRRLVERALGRRGRERKRMPATVYCTRKTSINCEGARRKLEQTPLQHYPQFVKLFNTSRLGFDLNATSKGRRETSDQSMMRDLMKQAYCPGSNGIWDPVLGTWVDKKVGIAAHLFPWRSADLMDSIFGIGARDELFSAVNGIFLHSAIEEAFDRGFLVIVPDTNLEPKDSAAPWEDKDERHQALKDWETTFPREYRITVFDATASTMQEVVFPKEV
ncbi:hypothetical protein B0T26DRAFT_772767 [Lasiosphaeria miniovina]|uniref:HNH nuclease domain-containing protein n=1 Tax=Lasiosphaeria miniovina TaxID=1954250 RepID=A0AA40AWH7_9PEZI|nr:uncharacterized protein B0T26DRAFT_772767 [Lasiosphaeria miniovina]KAK0723278.1 hypothetical protein B0T26DRAFT_772767 [Lasiosphaeria miniovina]